MTPAVFADDTFRRCSGRGSARLWLRRGVMLSAARLPPSQDAAAGFSFTNIARAAGLDARIVFGGQATNKYLLETTGTGVALIDYDNDGRLDLFFVNGSTLEGFPADARRPITSTGTRATARSRTSRRRRASRPAAGDRARASATTTTTATTISSSPTGARIASITTPVRASSTT